MAASVDIRAAPVTAMLIIKARSGPILSPFFSKCDGVLLIDQSDNSTEFHSHGCSGAQLLCDLILALKPRALVCGFIGDAEKHKLQRAGIDIRLGSCSCSIDELLAAVDDLPLA